MELIHHLSCILQVSHSFILTLTHLILITLTSFLSYSHSHSYSLSLTPFILLHFILITLSYSPPQMNVLNGKTLLNCLMESIRFVIVSTQDNVPLLVHLFTHSYSFILSFISSTDTPVLGMLDVMTEWGEGVMTLSNSSHSSNYKLFEKVGYYWHS